MFNNLKTLKYWEHEVRGRKLEECEEETRREEESRGVGFGEEWRTPGYEIRREPL